MSALLLPLPVLDNQPVRPAYAQGPRSLASVKLLRISVTDRCNFRCVYCMPDEGVRFHDADDLLTQDDIVAVARAAMGAGVTHLKLTGGEPTVRKDLPRIVAGLAALGPADLSLTTNGLLLEKLARPLRDAGLHRLTVSWDTMRPERFARIGRGAARQPGAYDQFLRGLDAAVAAGFTRLKINTVVVGGVNDDEVADFARLAQAWPWTVRFIEYMPLGDSTLVDASGRVEELGSAFTVDNAEILERIERELGPLTPVADRRSEAGVGPATVFQLRAAESAAGFAPGRVGFISAMSQPFCETCNRLRLTATGELRSCLFEGGEVPVLPALRAHSHLPADQAARLRDADLVRRMAACVAMKPAVHSSRGNRAMSQLGG